MNSNRVSIRGAVATALCLAAGMAAAQETTPSTTTPPAAGSTATQGKLEEVIVTAQKRTERLLDVPVAITAVQSETLTQENMVSIIDYFARIPNLQYNCRQTYCLSLRGLTTGDATNPTLAILIDDVPFGSALTAGLGNSRFPDLDPSTLDRLEVLRGPQGTLYGASTIGGLIKYVTKAPQTDAFSARVEAGVASVDGGSTEWNARGTLNLPFLSDRAALLVSGFDRHDPAYIDNVRAGNEGEDVNTTHIYGGNASLLFKLSDDFKITLSALKQKRDADYGITVQSLPTQPGLPPTYDPRYGEDKISLAPTSDVGNQELYTGRIEWDIGGLNLTSITAYGKSSGTNVQDLSAVFGGLFSIFYGYTPGDGHTVNIDDIADTNKFSEELRLSGKAGSLDWLLGVFYTDEDGTVDQTLTLFDPSGALVAVGYAGKNPMTYKETAVYADGTWHLNSQWDLRAGVRYAKNDQTNQTKQVIDDPLVPVFGPTGSAPKLDSSDNSFTFEVSPTYHINPDMMAYLRVASGYRPGGPNTALPNVPPAYDPDKVINYELGLKGVAANQTISYDLALFWIDWSDIQLQDTDAVSQFTYTTNGGKATSRGLEGTIQFRPLEGMTIGASATFLDAKLSEDLPVLAGANALVGNSGDRLPGSAKFSASGSIDQAFDLGSSLSASIGATVSYVGSRKSELVNSGAILPDGSLAKRFDLPDYTQVDLRAGLSTASNWHLNAYVRNVTDDDGVVYANNRNGTNTTTVAFLQPRTYGLSLSKDF
jgi:outer membrane receptor protein involved in Fe transport